MAFIELNVCSFGNFATEIEVVYRNKLVNPLNNFSIRVCENLHLPDWNIYMNGTVKKALCRALDQWVRENIAIDFQVREFKPQNDANSCATDNE